MKISKGQKLLFLGVVLVIIDQAIKIIVKTNMTYGESFNVIGQWFRICFIENNGMAFGMSFGGVIGKYILTVFRIVLSGVIIWWIKGLLKKEFPMGFILPLSLIAAGAIGNVIDCLFYGMIFSESLYDTVATLGGSYAAFMQGRVVDMFYFPIIDTHLPEWMPIIGGRHFSFFDPVFNFADSCVTVGTFWVLIYYIAHHKLIDSLEN